MGDRSPQPREVIVVVPAGLPAMAGDWVNAQRLASGLQRAGIQARVIDTAGLKQSAPPQRGAVVHALHAGDAGLPAASWAGDNPVVWTFTGTDLTPEAASRVRPGLDGVAGFTVYHAEAGGQLRVLLPTVSARLRVIPPGIERGTQASARRWGRQRPDPAPGGIRPWRRRGDVVLLLPAGLHPVKDPDLAVTILEHVRRAGVPARLWVAGPTRDPVFAAGFLERIAGRPFIHYLGAIPHESMRTLYERADIVLNTSRVEGLSNALLEAMLAGRAVLATDIPGNRAAIRNGIDGLLAPAGEMAGTALGLAHAPDQRRRMAQEARRSVHRRFDPAAEVRAHLQFYQDLLADREATEERLVGSE